jgi:3-methyladenine DNA glycosylase AlkD
MDAWDVCDQACTSLFDRCPLAWKKVGDWVDRDEEFVRRAAFATLAGLAWHDKDAPDDRFVALLPLVARAADDDRNYVRKAVSWALRNIGKRSRRLHTAAIATAETLRARGGTTARWIASDTIRDLSSEATERRLRARAALRLTQP